MEERIIMSTREDAKAFLAKLCSSMPRSCYSKLEATQRGFGFILDYLEQAEGEIVAGDFAKKALASSRALIRSSPPSPAKAQSREMFFSISYW